MEKLRSFFFHIWRRILCLWVKPTHIGLDPKELNIDPNKPVFYALQNKSLAGRIVLDQQTRTHQLPLMSEAFEALNLHEYQKVFEMKELTGWPFYGRSVPFRSPRLKRLIRAIHKDPEQDVQIVPVSIFWGRAPKREKSIVKLLLGDGWSPAGRLKMFFTLLFNGRNTFIQFNQPISLSELVEENLGPARTERKLARVLRVHFRNVRATVMGPDVSHRRTLVHRLIKKPMVKDAIKDYAQENKVSYEKSRARALKYADEIASNVSHTTIRFLDIVLTWLWNKLYDGVKVNHLDRLQQVHKDNEIIYVPCHRSHIDYLLLSYVLYNNGFMTPQIAAGINLNMPVVGSILRRGGAFFMRRSFKGQPLYSAVFDEYLHALFTLGYSVEYFVEGGRSRTGRMLPPRAGMLAMTLRSYLRDSKKPIIFMPVYIGYEKIFEGGSYLKELRGKNKKNESLFGLFKTLRNLKSRFGSVYLNFGEPIHFNEFLDTHQPDWREQEYGNEYRPDWAREVVDKLAVDVVTEINKAAAINPINLLSYVLLATKRQAMDERQLIEQVDSFKLLLEKLPYSDSITLPEGDGKQWLSFAEEMNVVGRIKHPMGDIISLDEANAIMLTYYRNNILHTLAIPSIIASLFINNSHLKKTEVYRLCATIYPYLKSELFLHWPEESVEEEVRAWLNILIDEGYLMMKSHQVTRPDPNSHQFAMLSVLSEAVIQTLQRYYIAIALLDQNGSGTVSPSELEEQSILMAQRIAILYGTNSPEFFDKHLFRNLISQLKLRQVVEEQEDGKLKFGERIEAIARDSRSLLNAEMRQSILQVTGDMNEAPEENIEKSEKSN